MAFGKKSKGQPISVQGLSKQIKLCIQTCYDLAGITVLQGPGDKLVRQIKASIGATSCVRDFLIFSKQLVFISCHFSSQIQAGFPFRGGKSLCNAFLSIIYFRIIFFIQNLSKQEARKTSCKANCT